MQSIGSAKVFLLIISLLFFYNNLSGQIANKELRYDERINVIINYTDKHNATPELKPVSQLLKEGVDGFIFELALNNDSSGIYCTSPIGYEFDFVDIIATINEFCTPDNDRLITLFFDYKFDVRYLLSLLQKSAISQKIWQGNPKMGWPTVRSLASDNKQIICFAINDNGDNILLKNQWEYAAEPYFQMGIEPKLNGEFFRGKLENDLLYLSSFQNPIDNTQQSSQAIDNLTDEANENPYFLAHSTNIWSNSGKKPNFIICNIYAGIYKNIRGHLQNHLSISGTVSFDRRPLTRVFWEQSNDAVSYGEYCFPIILNEDVYLKPKVPGYRFLPNEVLLKGVSKDVVQNFIAIPLELNNDMVAYYPFDTEIGDMGPHKLASNNSGGTLVTDSKRNRVLQLDGASFIELPKANEVGISNSDFTVSAWVKLAKSKQDGKRDCSILGTEESYYRGGLHLLTRNDIPYFGFFSNDLSGRTILDINRWYHIVWRYTKYNKEQAIFVNGVEDGSSYNHPAFVSNANLYIGKSIKQNNSYEGCIDDLIIWNRALGEDEIWKIYQDIFYVDDAPFTNYILRNMLWVGLILFIMASVVLAILKKKRGQARSIKIKKNTVSLPDFESKKNTAKINAIWLFGSFQVFDNQGSDITDMFTPRLKQILILLLIYSKNKAPGILSADFLNSIWPAFERKKAINNRSVSVSKLRCLLETMSGVNIIANQEYWKIELADTVYCDYYDYIKIATNKLHSNREELGDFMSIVRRGAFLQDSLFDWLDEFKGKVTNEVIDVLTSLLVKCDFKQNPEQVIQIADRILMVDDVNEEAMQFKVQALVALRQVNKAKFFFKSFQDRYYLLYKENYPQNFKKIIE